MFSSRELTGVAGSLSVRDPHCDRGDHADFLGIDQPESLRTLSSDVKKAKRDIQRIILEAPSKNDAGITRAETFVHILRVFETELSVQLKEWGDVSNIVKV